MPEKLASTPDPILELIAEEARFQALADPLTEEADRILFTIPEELRNDEAAREAAGCAELDRQAKVFEVEAEEVFNKIAATRASSFAGLAAEIQLLLGAETVHLPIILEGLLHIEVRCRLHRPRAGRSNHSPETGPRCPP